jgi:hypothetical protein
MTQVFDQSEWAVLGALQRRDMTLRELRRCVEGVPPVLGLWQRGYVKPHWIGQYGPPRRRKLLWQVTCMGRYWGPRCDGR